MPLRSGKDTSMRTRIAELLSVFFVDLRYTLRQLRRAPGFALTAILTMALAVGATAAMTGVLRATLLNLLPYPHAAQLVTVNDANLQGFKTNGLVTVARAEELGAMEHDGHKVFSSLGFFYLNNGQLTLPGHESLRAAGAAVSGRFFETIGQRPLLGRTITPEDDRAHAPLVAVLSRRFWQSTFAGDPHVLGRIIRLGTDAVTVVGVMPNTFALPAGIDVWYPGQISSARFGGYRGDGTRFMNVVGRLDESETPASAKQQTALLAAHLAAAYPGTDAAWGFTLTSLRTSLFGEYGRALQLISAAIALVLLVAAINIAGLQLSRNASRAPEFAIRAAVGVSRARLVRQLLTESTALVLIGALAGVALGSAALRLFAAHMPAALLQVARPRVDGAVLLISCSVALVIGVLTGLLPALRGSRASSTQTLARAMGSSMGSSVRRFGRTFAMSQIALALVVLTLSAHVLDSLYTLLHTSYGFQAEQLQGCSIELPWSTQAGERHHLFTTLEETLRAVPGVQAVGAATVLPLSSFSYQSTFDIAGRPVTAHHDTVIAEARALSPGYVHAMQIPLLAGRILTTQDSEPHAASVVLINEALAQRYFKEQNPVGQRLTSGRGVSGLDGVSEIIGVLGDVRGDTGTLASLPQPEVFGPEDGGSPIMNFAIRSTLPTAALEREVHRAVASIDAGASIGPLVPLSATIGDALAQPRLNAALLSCFALLSLLLVMVGVYGLVAFLTGQRSRKLALRIALGSSRERLLAGLLLENTAMLVTGLALGLLGSWTAEKLLAAALGTSGAHPSALFAFATGAIGLAVAGATYFPARRASGVDPMLVLRSE